MNPSFGRHDGAKYNMLIYMPRRRKVQYAAEWS